MGIMYAVILEICMLWQSVPSESSAAHMSTFYLIEQIQAVSASRQETMIKKDDNDYKTMMIKRMTIIK